MLLVENHVPDCKSYSQLAVIVNGYFAIHMQYCIGSLKHYVRGLMNLVQSSSLLVIFYL